MKILKYSVIITLIIIAAAGLGLAIFLNRPVFGKSPQAKDLERMPQSVHYRAGRFENPGGIEPDMNIWKALKLLPEWLNSKGKEPDWDLPFEAKTPQDFSLVDSVVQLTWFGHSTFLVQIGKKRLLLDPMLGQASAPVSFMTKRFSTLPIQAEDLPFIDAVLFSHDHYDHLDYPSILKLKDKVGHFFVPLGLGSHLKHWGVAESKITELDWWQEIQFFNLTFVCTPAQHFSGRGLGDRNKTLWASWVILSEKTRLFFSGDSGYFDGFTKIGNQYGPFDVCLLECGQYNERWQEIHMMPEETLQAHLDLKGKILIPIHWGAFNLALHTWTDPVERLLKAAENHPEIKVSTPIIGETVKLSTSIPQTTWWRKK